jgi:hypothetical protein
VISAKTWDFSNLPICPVAAATGMPAMTGHTCGRPPADQLIRWAKFTMNPSGPRTDAMRQMPSY